MLLGITYITVACQCKLNSPDYIWGRWETLTIGKSPSKPDLASGDFAWCSTLLLQAMGCAKVETFLAPCLPPFPSHLGVFQGGPAAPAEPKDVGHQHTANGLRGHARVHPSNIPTALCHLQEALAANFPSGITTLRLFWINKLITCFR